MIHQAFTDATATAAREKFKINKVQYVWHLKDNYMTN